jgi:Mg2+/Co2+ transporter CorB
MKTMCWAERLTIVVASLTIAIVILCTQVFVPPTVSAATPIKQALFEAPLWMGMIKVFGGLWIVLRLIDLALSGPRRRRQRVARARYTLWTS